MARRSPQEKKRISYAKDRRNAYAENDKSSRNAVRLNKRFPNRANRHHLQQILQGATGSRDDDRAAEIEEGSARRRPKRWKKYPDLPLGDWVESRLQRRLKLESADGGAFANEQRLVKVQRQRFRGRDQRTRRTAQVATKGTIERYW